MGAAVRDARDRATPAPRPAGRTATGERTWCPAGWASPHGPPHARLPQGPPRTLSPARFFPKPILALVGQRPGLVPPAGGCLPPAPGPWGLCPFRHLTRTGCGEQAREGRPDALGEILECSGEEEIEQPGFPCDEVAEWLRRWTANPLCSARVGSNPILVGWLSFR